MVRHLGLWLALLCCAASAAHAQAPSPASCPPAKIADDELATWRKLPVERQLFEDRLLAASLLEIGCLRGYELSALTTMIAVCEAYGQSLDERQHGECQVARNLLDYTLLDSDGALGLLLFAHDRVLDALRSPAGGSGVDPDVSGKLKRIIDIRWQWRTAMRLRQRALDDQRR